MSKIQYKKDEPVQETPDWYDWETGWDGETTVPENDEKEEE